MHDVKIYTTPTCTWCTASKRYFRQRGVQYQEIDVSRDQHSAHEMVHLSGQMGVPVIVVDNEVIVGFDKQRLDQLLT